jgi:hypothetical protein
MGRLLDLHANIRLGGSDSIDNTLAYYNVELIIVVNEFYCIF